MTRMLAGCMGLSVLACGGGEDSPNADGPDGETSATGAADTMNTAADSPDSTGSLADSSGGGTTEPSDDSAGETASADSGGQATGGTEDLDMTPEDFACLLDWPRVRRFRVTNLLGYEDEAMAVAENPDGGVYPVGTVIQLIPNEAMVKRADGWSEETSDWEFFSLATSAAGTEIEARGTTETINAFGGNCFSCHAKAAPQWDLICEQDHGCDPIPIPEATINMLQENDPRCR